MINVSGLLEKKKYGAFDHMIKCPYDEMASASKA
jgi:hypothetical protein